jgi:dihydropteroate synthase
MKFGGVALDRPRVMAIVNVTPDSFSDGGERLDPARAVEDGLRFLSEGADFVDVGGESTRPGSRPTPADEELRRVLPVVEGLSRHKAIVSIDTRRALVAARSRCRRKDRERRFGLARRRGDAPTGGGRGADVVLMHRRGLPENTFAGPAYGNVVEEVRAFLMERAELCEAGGVKRGCIAIDPASASARASPRARVASRNRTPRCVGLSVLVGSSRKSFIGKLTGVERAADRDPALGLARRRGGTAGRRHPAVHDVAGTRQALAVWAAMR